MKMKLKKKLKTIGIFTLSCVLLLGMSNCKQIVVPNGIITVSNECGLAIDVFFDGVFQFSLEYEATRSVEDLDDGTYELEARRKGTGEFIARETLAVRFNAIYTWSVWSSAKIKIINKYGETLGIYGDDFYSGDVEDQLDVTLEHVPYGDRKMEAKTSDETVVATTTISVLADNTYEWTIIK